MTLAQRRKTTALGLVLAATCAAGPALADMYIVTTTADEGDGSLRSALAAAAATDEASQIVVTTDGDIEIASTLDYTGSAPLLLVGNGQAVIAAANVTLLSVSNGADLTVVDLDFTGPGGFDMEARGDLDGPAGKGIFVDVRDDQTGTVTLRLDGVTVSGTAGHGIHVSDCTLADDCGGGGGGAGEGSPASVAVFLQDVAVIDAARGRFDADGVRVDERGEGDILFTAIGSTFEGVGADGVELDEGQAGDVSVTVIDSAFLDNGDYCDPARLAAFMPEEDEGEFEEGEVAESDIPGPITGSPDDGCFEREVDLHDDGSVEEYEIAIDVDDGFDIDEAGPGSLIALIIESEMAGNFDEGFDFDEEDAGDIDASFIGTTATGNTDDGYKMSEADEGDVIGTVLSAEGADNGGVGFVFEEEDEGDVMVTLIDVATSGNDDGDLGVEVVQEDEGEGEVVVVQSDLADGSETEGATLIMN